MTQSIEAKLLSVLVASVLALASYAIVASTTTPVVLAQEDRQQTKHGSQHRQTRPESQRTRTIWATQQVISEMLA